VCHKEVLDEITKELETQCSKRKSKNQNGSLKVKQTLFFDSFKTFLAQHGRLTEMIEKSNADPLKFFSCN